VFLLAGLIAGSSTLITLDVSGETAIRDWADRHGELKLRVGLIEIAALLGLIFAVELKLRLDRWGARRKTLLTFTGGLLLVALVAASGWVSAAVVAVDDLQGEPQVAKAFLLLDWSFGVGMSAALAAMAAGVATAAIRLHTLPRWLAYLGIFVTGALALNAALWQTGSRAALGLLWLPGLALAIRPRADSHSAPT
jgi:hypothetical protein